MLATYFEQGGPLMYALLVAWVIVLAGAIDRTLFAFARVLRRPSRAVSRLVRAGDRAAAEARVLREGQAARAGLSRLDSISQLATSVGLFGTVLGIARGFLARGTGADAASRLESLASGLSTALFTTIAGLGVYLFGQGALIVYREWLAASERRIERALGESR